MLQRWLVTAAAVALLAQPVAAQPAEPATGGTVPDTGAPAPPPAPEPPAPPPPTAPVALPVDPMAADVAAPGVDLRKVVIHGFVSEGGFLSTSNDYIGTSSRGSLELFEAGINFSSEITDRLHAGVQLFARDFGAIADTSPRLDWAFLDYRWRRWLGLRAGIIKMPFGLYNEYTDIDSARLPILMPQGVYPYRARDVLLAHRGFTAYGNARLGARGGELDYQVWLGTLSVPRNALDVLGATLDSVDTRYVTGAQVFWSAPAPIEGLRIGGTLLRASIDFHLTLSAENTQALIMMGLVPADYDGAVVISQRPDTFAIASVEYAHQDWLFAAEYSRAFKHQQSSLPAVLPPFDEDSEQLYGMVAYRPTAAFETGGYYSVHNLDADDRGGSDKMKYPERYYAFQRDLAVTMRYDVNDHWLWKLEGHLMDGTADLTPGVNAKPDRYWGLFMFRTTVTF